MKKVKDKVTSIRINSEIFEELKLIGMPPQKIIDKAVEDYKIEKSRLGKIMLGLATRKHK